MVNHGWVFHGELMTKIHHHHPFTDENRHLRCPAKSKMVASCPGSPTCACDAGDGAIGR